MSAARVLWGQIFVVFTIAFATTWGATEWTSWRLAFQPELGPSWFVIGSWPFYVPPAFFWWWYHFDAYAPPVFVEGAFFAASGGFASIAVAILMSISRAQETKNIFTYGSARWATASEVRAAGMLAQDGVALGRLTRDYACGSATRPQPVRRRSRAGDGRTQRQCSC
jgi:type IV secretion system protein VirD4